MTRIVTGLPGQRGSALGVFLQTIPPGETTTLVLEGAPADGTQEIAARPDISIHILAPGCMCCIGNLVLRVTLARVLRLEQPQHLILGLVDALHRDRLVQMLLAPPYDAWIELVDQSGTEGLESH